jgi:catechol 2,3-dioxygenase-like lactoylglutathione lyase family enzyme
LLLKKGSKMNVLKPHVSLNVSNIDASVAFYEKIFQVGPSKRRPGYAKFDLKEPSLNLSMVEGTRTGVNASHFGIQVASSEDVAAAWTRFKEAGLDTRTEENTSCCYALQDKVWVADPDGNEWEVFVVKGDTDRMHDEPTKVACCVPQATAPSRAKAGGGCCG